MSGGACIWEERKGTESDMWRWEKMEGGSRVRVIRTKVGEEDDQLELVSVENES